MSWEKLADGFSSSRVWNFQKDSSKYPIIPKMNLAGTSWKSSDCEWFHFLFLFLFFGAPGTNKPLRISWWGGFFSRNPFTWNLFDQLAKGKHSWWKKITYFKLWSRTSFLEPMLRSVQKQAFTENLTVLGWSRGLPWPLTFAQRDQPESCCPQLMEERI